MTKEKIINIGYASYVLTDRILAILNPKSAPMRRLREDAKEDARLIDVTYGKPTRSIIVLDSNHVVLSSISSDTIRQRFILAITSPDSGQTEGNFTDLEML